MFKKIFITIVVVLFMSYFVLQGRLSTEPEKTTLKLTIEDTHTRENLDATITTYPSVPQSKDQEFLSKGEFLLRMSTGTPVVVVVKAPGYHTKIRLKYFEPNKDYVMLLEKK